MLPVGWGLSQQKKAPTTKQQMLSDGLSRTITRFRCWLGLQIPQDSIQRSEILSELLRILWTAVSFPGRNDLDLCLRELPPITAAQHRRITDDIRGCCSESAQSKSVIGNVHLSPVSLQVRRDRLLHVTALSCELSITSCHRHSNTGVPAHPRSRCINATHLVFFNPLCSVSQGERDFFKCFIGILLCSFDEQQCVELTDKTWRPNTDYYR